MEKSDQDSLQLYFNIGDIGKTENIHKAELRVYKTKARRKSVHIGVNSIHHFHKAEIRSVYGNKLLTSKLVYSGGFGWETFDLTTAVRQWVMTPDTNKGILVIIKKSVPYQAAIDFDTGHHPKHEPILVVYSDENIGNNATTTSSNNNYVPDEMDRYKRQRMRRQVGKSGCKRVDMMVDVSTITAWNLFILQPRLFNAYRCDGKCGAYPSKEEGSRTHHATIQAILSELEPKRLANVKPPCCAPRELEPLTLLLFDIVKGSEIVKLQTLKDMVVTKCGCL